MAKTLLQITQEILTVMTSDEVNSITDTSEAEGVARIVMSVFESQVSTKDWPSHKGLIQLDSFSDNDRPTHCSLPSFTKRLVSVYYNKRTAAEPTRDRYKVVKWMENDAFQQYINARDSTATICERITDPSGVKLLILNNKHPNYYTSFDDETVVFDSYESDVDDTIQPSQMQVVAYTMPQATFSDSWEPDLPAEAIKGLIEEAKSVARFQLDSVSDTKAEQEAKRQRRWISRNAWSVNGGIKYPDYGRRSVHVRERTFKQGNN